MNPPFARVGPSTGSGPTERMAQHPWEFSGWDNVRPGGQSHCVTQRGGHTIQFREHCEQGNVRKKSGTTIAKHRVEGIGWKRDEELRAAVFTVGRSGEAKARHASNPPWRPLWVDA